MLSLTLALAQAFQASPPERLLREYLAAYDAGGARLTAFLRTGFDLPKDSPGLRERLTADQLRQRKASGSFTSAASRRRASWPTCAAAASAPGVV